MAELPSGTVTFLFTDIEGSTRLLQQLGDGYRSVIADHHRLLRESIESSGHVVEDRGDGLFAVFSRAVDALATAVAAQRALAAHRWPADGAVRVRMGLHTGEPALVGSNYVGLDVHRAARLSDAGHGGQVLLSATTRELVDAHLPEGVTLNDLGEYRLRDIARPEHIFQVVIAGLPSTFPPPRTAGRAPNNLPRSRDPLIGRDREVAAARDLLVRDDVGLVTLTGAGGAGKTRLGLQVAASVLDRFEDGVFLVMLAPISDPALVPATVAAALGLRSASDRPVLDVVAEYLREREVLLLLDNFEQVVPAAPAVAHLLSACPRLKILVTSRALLHLRGEHELAVPPLALPASGADVSVERIQQYAAVALFAERARETRPDFAITTESAPAVAEICQRLDGLPLAIELAAARVRLLNPQAMLGRMSRRLPFLTGGSRDLPARQQTLRDTIAWSYDLLDPAEQRLFECLGVFVGGWTLEAAELVAGAPTTDDETTPLDVLAALVDKSLVRRVDGPAGEPRFTMLETIREYAVERLDARGEAQDTRRRHAEYFTRFAKHAEPELLRVDGGTWMDRLEADHDNLRAALAWCDDSGAGLWPLARLVAPLWMFWSQRGHWTEGRGWFDRALEQVSDPVTRLSLIPGAGSFAVHRGDYARTVSLWEEALALSRATGDRAMEVYAQSRLGYAAALRGEGERAWALTQDGLTVSRQLGDLAIVARALMDVGHAAQTRDDYAGAAQAWEECVHRSREAGLAFLEPYALQLWSGAVLSQGNLSLAAALVDEALGLFRRRDDHWGIVGCLSRLVHIALVRRDRDGVRHLAFEVLILARSLGSQSALADGLSYLGWVARLDGDSERAARLFGAAEAIRTAIGRRLDSLWQRRIDAQIAALKEVLGDAAFAAAWSEGRAMSTDRAVKYALEEIESP